MSYTIRVFEDYNVCCSIGAWFCCSSSFCFWRKSWGELLFVIGSDYACFWSFCSYFFSACLSGIVACVSKKYLITWLWLKSYSGWKQYILEEFYVTLLTAFKTCEKGFQTCIERANFIGNSQFIWPFNSANWASIFKILFFSESELKRDGQGLDGIVVSKSILKTFTVVLGILNQFNASRTSIGVAVMLLVVTERLTSSHIIQEKL